MGQHTVRELYEKYAGAMAYIEVVNKDGDVGIGSAFHIGSNVLITARHVVENKTITEIATAHSYHVPDPEGNVRFGEGWGPKGTHRLVSPAQLELTGGPYFHPNRGVDVAALVVREIDAPSIPLGSHLDDWLNDSAFVLAETLILGFPPIPFSDAPRLVAARGEINTVIDPYTDPKHPQFIVSAMPRGGFSGGVCLIEWDFALGVVTESLVRNMNQPELGYMSVLTVEPIYVCLQHHGIVPSEVGEGWDGFWGD